MVERGRYLDNIFIERLWRSLKQEAIYLEEISDGFQARRVIKKWITFYNTERPHSALDRQTPDDAYWAGLEQQKAYMLPAMSLKSKNPATSGVRLLPPVRRST